MKIKCIILFLLITSSAFGQINYEDESLRGLKGVFVIIEGLSPDIEADGLKKEQIQTDVELKLRLAGIQVISQEEWMNDTGGACLYVNVNDVKTKTDIYSFIVSVEFSQSVYLVRDPKIFSHGITWNVGTIGTVGKQYVSNYVRETIRDYVDEFINDYLSVNPK